MTRENAEAPKFLKKDQEANPHLFPKSARWVITTWHWQISGSAGYSARSSSNDIQELVSELDSMKKAGHAFKVYDNETGIVYNYIGV